MNPMYRCRAPQRTIQKNLAKMLACDKQGAKSFIDLLRSEKSVATLVPFIDGSVIESIGLSNMFTLTKTTKEDRISMLDNWMKKNLNEDRKLVKKFETASKSERLLIFYDLEQKKSEKKISELKNDLKNLSKVKTHATRISRSAKDVRDIIESTQEDILQILGDIESILRRVRDN